MNWPQFIISAFISRRNILPLFQFRRKPRVIQLPITSRCNSRCVTCNVWKDREKIDVNPAVLVDVFKNKYFERVQEVGINGGEITLVPNFDEIIDSVLTLPKLRSLYLISNGLLPDKLLDLLERTKTKCEKRQVLLFITISVDGVGEIHELVRGIPKCFSRTKRLLDCLYTDKNRYADGASIGCTLSQKNIPYIIQTESFLSEYSFPVQYHIAVPNKRIRTFDDAKDYYLVDDEYSRLLGAEFFYRKFTESSLCENKYFYFAQYYFLNNKGKGRLCPCQYRYQDVTIDENNKLYLCATASDEIGVLTNNSIEKIVKNKSLNNMQSQVNQYCDTCVHYMDNTPTPRGLLLFIYEILITRFNWVYKFKLLTKWR